MTPEVIGTLISAFGAVGAILLGIHNASKKAMASTPEAPSRTEAADMLPKAMLAQVDRLRDIERLHEEGNRIMRQVLEAFEGNASRQSKILDELESCDRTLIRLEQNQNMSMQLSNKTQHQGEIMAGLLTQIRDNLK